MYSHTYFTYIDYYHQSLIKKNLYLVSSNNEFERSISISQARDLLRKKESTAFFIRILVALQDKLVNVFYMEEIQIFILNVTRRNQHHQQQMSNLQ